MSIIDSMFDQFYEHLGECEQCEDELSAMCEKGRKLYFGLKELEDGHSDSEHD